MQINKERESKVVRTDLVMNQKDFIKHFNEKKEKMISAPDIYKTAKDEDKGLIESFAKDFNDRWVVTSTRIKYGDDGFAEIIHDTDSLVVKSKSVIVDAPYIQDKAEYSEVLEKFLQTLFDTKDDYQEIVKVLKRFDKDKTLYIWLPDKSSRIKNLVRAVFLYFYYDRFNVEGDWIGDGNGLSRGVSVVESAKQTNKKRGVKDE